MTDPVTVGAWARLGLGIVRGLVTLDKRKPQERRRALEQRAHALEQAALILSADAIRHRQIERSEAMTKRARRFHGRRARRAERKRDRILARAMFWRAEAARYQRGATP
jgi:hypothetical protein